MIEAFRKIWRFAGAVRPNIIKSVAVSFLKSPIQAQAEEQKSAMLNDYMTNHSDKTWQEYLVWYNKTKKGETKK